MNGDRLDECRSQLAGMGEQPLEARAERLEQIHGALVAELDDLLDDGA